MSEFTTVETSVTDALSNRTTSTRQVKLHDVVIQRFTEQQLPTIAELRDQMRALISDLQATQADYQEVTQDLDSYYAPLKDAEARAAELRRQLAKVEAEIAEFKKDGSPKDQYLKHVSQAENQVSVFSRAIIARLLENEAQKIFKVRFKNLSAATKRDLGLQFEPVFRRFTNFARLYRAELPTEDQINATVASSVDALNYLLTNTQDK